MRGPSFHFFLSRFVTSITANVRKNQTVMITAALLNASQYESGAYLCRPRWQKRRRGQDDFQDVPRTGKPQTLAKGYLEFNKRFGAWRRARGRMGLWGFGAHKKSLKLSSRLMKVSSGFAGFVV